MDIEFKYDYFLKPGSDGLMMFSHFGGVRAFACISRQFHVTCFARTE